MTNNIDDDFLLDIAKHMGTVTAELSNVTEKLGTLTDVVHDVQKDQQVIQKHNDKVVHELQTHFDNKLTKCSEDIMDKLQRTHLDEPQVRNVVTKAVKASELRMAEELKDSEKRIHKIYGALIVSCGTLFGFIYNYWEPISNFINNLKGN